MNKKVKIPILNITITRRLILDLCLHFFSSLFLAVFFYTVKGNLFWPTIAFLSGIFIDLDHLIDYFLHIKKWNLNSFLNCQFVIYNKIYLPFHGWEYVIILTLLSFKINVLVPLTAGISIHLIIDTLMHARNNPFTYFITYRLFHNFKFDKINYYLFKRQINDIADKK